MTVKYRLCKFRKSIRIVASLNNFKLDDLVDAIYPIELEINDTTDTTRSDLYLEIDSGGRLKMKFTTKEMISMFPL